MFLPVMFCLEMFCPGILFHGKYMDSSVRPQPSNPSSVIIFLVNNYLHYFIFKFQWLGDDRLRRILEGKLLLLRLVCETVSGVFQDATAHPLAAVSDAGSTRRRQISQPCLALRIAGSPGKTTQQIF